MAKWEKFNLGGHAAGCIETLSPCDGLKITVTNVQNVPDWNITVKLNKGSVYLKKEYVAIPDAGEVYTMPMIQAKAEELAKKYLTELSAIVNEGLSKLTDSSAPAGKTIKYHAAADFNVLTSVCVNAGAGSDEIRAAIIDDLEDRYGLTIDEMDDGSPAE